MTKTIKLGWESFMYHVCQHLRTREYVAINKNTVINYLSQERIYPEYATMDDADWKKLFDLMFNQLNVSKSLHVNRAKDTVLELTIR